jgi:hypothetical protein
MTKEGSAISALAAVIRAQAEDLTVYLGSWQAGGRRALTDAVKAIDALLRNAYELRDSLIRQAREFDDEAMRRSADLLARLRAEREAGQRP